MSDLDPRLNAYRPDLAAEPLRDQVAAERYTPGRPMQVCRGAADLRRGPDRSAGLDSQLLFGETVTVFDQGDGWAWVQNWADGYVGYVPAQALAEVFAAPGHMVAVLRTFRYPEPNVKAPPLEALSMTSLIEVTGEREAFSEIAGGGWIYSRHLVALDEPAPDYVATALEFLGAPYLWGGKQSLGLDCSGLVQLALARAGLPCLRDTYMQAGTLGEAVEGPPERGGARRGDILYMPGHVAIALDAERVVHANAHAMLVTVEALWAVVERVRRESGRGLDVVRRPQKG